MKTSKSRRRKTSHSRKKSSKKEKKAPTHKRVPEYVDWIDTKGKRIGIVDRELAHDYGLWHYAVHVFIFDEKGKIVLQHRPTYVRLNPGKWDSSAGGHVPTGMSLEKAAQMEAHEEMGVRIPVHSLGYIDVVDHFKEYYNRERIYYYWVQTKKKIRFDKGEVAGIGRVALKDLSRFIQKEDVTNAFTSGWKKFGGKLIKKMNGEKA